MYDSRLNINIFGQCEDIAGLHANQQRKLSSESEAKARNFIVN